MRKYNSLLIIAFILSFFFLSCEKEPGTKKGKVEFNSTIEDGLKSLKSTDSTIVISHAIIEIQNAVGEIILSNEEIALTKFGESYLSDPIDLTTGRYILTKFLLVNSENVVVYAAPLEGSEKAYLVNNPLPLEFVIDEDVVTKVSPEVIDAIGQTAASFGYATFSFNVVETFDFLVATFIYNDNIENFTLTDANIKITANSEVVYQNMLASKTNQITLPSGYSNYSILITKPGYQPHELSLSEDSLKGYFNSPLTIIFKQVEVNTGLFAYYPFNSSLTDLSGNGFDATNYGCTYTSDRFGNANAALYFNGTNNYIVLPDAARFVPLQSTTLSFWIKTSQTTRFDLFNQRSGDHDPSLFNHGIIANRDLIGRLDYRFPGYDDGTQFTTEQNFCDNVWHLITFIKDCENQTITIYTDKQLIYTWQMVDVDFTIDGQLIVGKEFRDVYFFNGAIDDVRIYHRALTSGEVEELTEQ